MNRKHNLMILLTAVIGFLFLLTACQDQGAADSPAETEQQGPSSPVEQVNTISVDTGVASVSAEGEVIPLRNVDLSFQTGGQVAEILVDSGDNVALGAPMIRLDAFALENALSQAEAGLAASEAARDSAAAQLAVAESAIQRAEAGITAAEAQLALVQAGPTEEEIAAAEQNLAATEAAIVQAAGNRDASVSVNDAQVQSAQAQLISAQAEVDTLQETYDDIIDLCFEIPGGDEVCPLYGPVEENTRFQLEAAKANLAAAQTALEEARAGATPAQRQLANTGVGVAMAQRDQAQAQLDLLLAGAREEQIQQAEVGVLQAELVLEQAQVQVSQAEAALAQAEAAVVKSKADVDGAQVALDKMTLTAPFDGTVGDVMTEVGELVAPGVAVVTFGDLGGWLVNTTDLTEVDIVAVENGLTAEIELDALPGEIISGTVTDIASVSTLEKGDVTYKVEITLDETGDLPVRWGMTALVTINTES